MSRRTTLPGADELFRVTSSRPEPAAAPAPDPVTAPAAAPAPPSAASLLMPAVPAVPAPAEESTASVATLPGQPRATELTVDETVSSGDADGPELASSRRRVTVSRRSPRSAGAVDRRSSGRERHEEKITVYVSPEELFDLEHARLVLRGEHGIAIDRGRIVREAIAVVMADFDAKGAQSILVRRLGAL